MMAGAAEEGATASSVSGGGDGLVAVAIADFVNSIYSYAGGALTLADVINTTGHVSASGLILSTPVNILNQFLTLLLTQNWTVVIEFVPSTGNYELYLLSVLSTDLFSQQVAVYTSFGNGAAYDNDFVGNERGGGIYTDNTIIVGSLNRIAATRTDALLAVSLNGDTVVEDTAPLADVVTNVAQTGDGTSNGGPPMGYITSIKIYAPQASADLPGMSVL